MKEKVFIIVLLLAGLWPVLHSHAQKSSDGKKSRVIEKVDGVEYYMHTMEKKQTLYSIAKLYQVDMEILVSLNPVIREGLRMGQVLKIPVNPSVLKKTSEKPKNMLRQEALTDSLKVLKEIKCSEGHDNLKKTYNVALMLPLKLEEVDSIPEYPVTETKLDDYESFRFLPFYEGFCLAVDSLTETGLNVRVYVYDVNEDSASIRTILRKPELRAMDMIVGLLYNKSFSMVADFAKANNINIVNPLSDRTGIIKNNPRVFKVKPAVKYESVFLSMYIGKNYKNANIIVIGDINPLAKEADDAALFDETEPSIDTALLRTFRKKHAGNKNIHVVSTFADMSKYLKSPEMNLILLISENKVMVMDYLTKLNELRNRYQLTLFGLPCLEKIDGLESEYLVNLNTHSLSPYFIDYDEKNVRRFLQLYRDKYKTDPHMLAFEGFDLSMYFMSALMKYGRSFEHCIHELRMDLMGTRYNFHGGRDGNGYENAYWNLYKYEDYKLIRIM